jgi:hypothetical protein
MPSSPPATVIRLRPDAFAAWAARLGLETEGAQAEHIGVDRTTLSRVRRGDIIPGERFIAAVLAASGCKFEKLFEVVQ